MLDLQSVFRVSSTPTLGTPVFALDYRAYARPPVWWQRVLARTRRWIRQSIYYWTHSALEVRWPGY